MHDTTAELRRLLYDYDDRYVRLQKNYLEAKDENDQAGMDTCKALQSQCRVMIAELWHVMVKVGALDEEEIEFGSIKKEK